MFPTATFSNFSSVYLTTLHQLHTMLTCNVRFVNGVLRRMCKDTKDGVSADSRTDKKVTVKLVS
jgi:hypothetical protein